MPSWPLSPLYPPPPISLPFSLSPFLSAPFLPLSAYCDYYQEYVDDLHVAVLGGHVEAGVTIFVSLVHVHLHNISKIRTWKYAVNSMEPELHKYTDRNIQAVLIV